MMDAREVAHYFRDTAEALRKEWVDQMLAKGLLKDMSPEDVEAESKTIYDACITCLETGKYTKAEEYASTRASSGVVHGLTITDFLSGMLTLRDLYNEALMKMFSEGSSIDLHKQA